MPLSVLVVGTFVLLVSDAFDRSVAVEGFTEDKEGSLASSEAYVDYLRGYITKVSSACKAESGASAYRYAELSAETDSNGIRSPC